MITKLLSWAGNKAHFNPIMEIGALHCRSQAVLDSVENLLVHAVFIFTPKLFFLKAFAVGSVMAALQASFLFLKALSSVLSIVRLGLSSSLRLFSFGL